MHIVINAFAKRDKKFKPLSIRKDLRTMGLSGKALDKTSGVYGNLSGLFIFVNALAGQNNKAAVIANDQSPAGNLLRQAWAYNRRPITPSLKSSPIHR